MAETVIKVESLSKLYHLGVISSGTLSSDLSRWWAKYRGLPDPMLKVGQKESNSNEAILALNNITFDVKQGEALGIIGKNGAGKSTLLKVLSRITAPTSGTVKIKGRIAALLEVGTGFHPELTGRENIFLNGAILGMTKAEIRNQLDEIIDFSGVEKFIDTPVKRYSSGMRVRLAFAVAAHLDPEILIIDEVLAVGDAEFQKKCIGKMEDVSKNEGRTVLFVSHNMAAVKALCTKCIMLKNGIKLIEGNTSSVIEEYLAENNIENFDAEAHFKENPDKEFQLRSVIMENLRGEAVSNFECDEPVHIRLKCDVRSRVPGLYGYLNILKPDETIVMESDSYDVLPNKLDNLELGVHNFKITIPARTLAPGKYLVYLNFTSKSGIKGFNIDSPGIVCSFELYDSITYRGNNRKGFFSTRINWELINKKQHA